MFKVRRMESTSGLSLFSFHEKFQPPKTYAFPKRKFGLKCEERSCRAVWFNKHDWLHHDATADFVFCHLCLSAEFEKRFLVNTKRDPAFISNEQVHILKGWYERF